MKRVVLISCGKTKLTHRAPAGALYIGALFVKSLAFAHRLAPDNNLHRVTLRELPTVIRVAWPRYSPLKKIQESGLWQANQLYRAAFSVEEFEEFERSINCDSKRGAWIES